MDVGLIFGDFVSQVIFPVILAVVTIIIGLAARKLDKRFNTAIFSDNISNIMSLAEHAGQYAEEKAMSWAKDRGKITGQEKLDLAVAWLMERAPEITTKQAEEWIEAVLPLIGEGSTARD